MKFCAWYSPGCWQSAHPQRVGLAVGAGGVDHGPSQHVDHGPIGVHGAHAVSLPLAPQASCLVGAIARYRQHPVPDRSRGAIASAWANGVRYCVMSSAPVGKVSGSGWDPPGRLQEPGGCGIDVVAPR